jgi:hypothetical protein
VNVAWVHCTVRASTAAFTIDMNIIMHTGRRLKMIGRSTWCQVLVVVFVRVES